MEDRPWKMLNRKKVFDSRFVKVYEDTVELPNGNILEDYTVVEKPSIVVIVATDEKNNIFVLREYKHGAQKVLWTLPAGHKPEHESAVEAAQRELKEEVGATGGVFEELGVLHDYPSKDIHKTFVVRAKNVVLTDAPNHEETESIACEILSIGQLKEQVKKKEWHSSLALAALTFSGILFDK